MTMSRVRHLLRATCSRCSDVVQVSECPLHGVTRGVNLPAASLPHNILPQGFLYLSTACPRLCPRDVGLPATWCRRRHQHPACHHQHQHQHQHVSTHSTTLSSTSCSTPRPLYPQSQPTNPLGLPTVFTTRSSQCGVGEGDHVGHVLIRWQLPQSVTPTQKCVLLSPRVLSPRLQLIKLLS